MSFVAALPRTSRHLPRLLPPPSLCLSLLRSLLAVACCRGCLLFYLLSQFVSTRAAQRSDNNKNRIRSAYGRESVCNVVSLLHIRITVHSYIPYPLFYHHLAMPYRLPVFSRSFFLFAAAVALHLMLIKLLSARCLMLIAYAAAAC